MEPYTLEVKPKVHGRGGVVFDGWEFGENALLDTPDFAPIRPQVLGELQEVLLEDIKGGRALSIEVEGDKLSIVLSFGDIMDCGYLEWQVPLGLINKVLTNQVSDLIKSHRILHTALKNVGDTVEAAFTASNAVDTPMEAEEE